MTVPVSAVFFVFLAGVLCMGFLIMALDAVISDSDSQASDDGIEEGDR